MLWPPDFLGLLKISGDARIVSLLGFFSCGSSEIVSFEALPPACDVHFDHQDAAEKLMAELGARSLERR